MGSGIRPDSIVVLGAEDFSSITNFASSCTRLGKGQSSGIFFGDNPLRAIFSLLLWQGILTTVVIVIAYRFLKPLGQPLMYAQILGGVIIGPSLLTKNSAVSNLIFPLKSMLTLDVFSIFGFMFYTFLIGVQTDLRILKKIDRKAVLIGFFTVAMGLTLSSAWAAFLLRNINANIDKRMARILPTVARSESMLFFPMITYFLTELRIINSEFGRVAVCSSMVCNLCSFSFTTATLLMHVLPNDRFVICKMVLYLIGLTAIIFVVLRPLLLWVAKHNMVEQQLHQSFILLLFVAVLMTGYCGQALGLHIALGPLILGLTIPAGPPVGSALVEKLQAVISWMLMPLYFARNGLIVDVFAVSGQKYAQVQSTALMAATGKFLGAFVAARYSQMPLRDCVSLGLILNAQGIFEISLFKLMMRHGVLDEDCFTTMCVSMLIVTGTCIQIVRYLYDPSRRYMVPNRRTVMHSRPDSELRLLICVYEQESVTAAINFLEALNPSTYSPLAVYLLYLVELVGNAVPLLITHKVNKKPTSKPNTSEHIINAFRHFEQTHRDYITVFPFTAISPPKTLHNDVCTMALDKRTSLIVIPFYRRFSSTGEMQSHNKAMRIANQNVLDKSPCSVAVLIERGPIKNLRPIYPTWTSYNVAVIFLGGADDQEALTIAIRMAGLPNTNLTMVRLLYSGPFPAYSVDESQLDNDIVNEFREMIGGTLRVNYVEEVVADGAGTAAAMRTIKDQYQLLVLGRRHHKLNPILAGLTEWNENKDLGTMGELMVSADFLGDTTILVVQQHTCEEDDYLREIPFDEVLTGHSPGSEESDEKPFHRKFQHSWKTEYSV